MRSVVVIFSTLALAACANTSQVSNKILGLNGIELSQTSEGANVIESYTVSSEINREADLPFCIASSLKNDSVRVKGAGSSYMGAHSGRQYKSASEHTVGGGDVISYVSKEADKVVATGTTRYIAGVVVERSVRFQVVGTKSGGDVKLVFSPIEQAQTDTGALENRGYYRVGAWDAAHPDKVVESIDVEAQKIIRCLEK